MNKPEDPIRIGDLKYKFDDLPLDAQTYIKAITRIDENLNQLASQMDMLQMARQGYIGRLNTTLEKHNALQEQPEEGVQPQSAAS